MRERVILVVEGTQHGTKFYYKSTRYPTHLVRKKKISDAPCEEKTSCAPSEEKTCCAPCEKKTSRALCEEKNQVLHFVVKKTQVMYFVRKNNKFMYIVERQKKLYTLWGIITSYVPYAEKTGYAPCEENKTTIYTTS